MAVPTLLNGSKLWVMKKKHEEAPCHRNKILRLINRMGRLSNDQIKTCLHIANKYNRATQIKLERIP